MHTNHLHDGRLDERGFSLVEVIIAATILAGLVLMVSSALMTGNNTFQSVTNKSNAEMKAMQVLSQIVQHVQNGGLDGLTAAGSDTTVLLEGDPTDGIDNDGDSTVDNEGSTTGWRQQIVTGWSNGLVFGETVEVLVEAAESNITNGIDDDDDNLIDEVDCKIVKWDTAPPVDAGGDGSVYDDAVTITRVGEGLGAVTLAIDGNQLTIAVTVQRWDHRIQETRTYTATKIITLRN